MLLSRIFFRRHFCLLFFQVIFWICQPGHAQRFEFGSGFGLLQYKGDLQPGYFPNKPSAAVELIGRYNLSMAAVLRANLLFAPHVVASSENSSDPYINNLQPVLGMSTYLAEAGIFGEYNFFNYRNPKNRYIFGTPYLFGGPALSVSKVNTLDNTVTDTVFDLHNGIRSKPPQFKTLILPSFVMGVGYKQQLGQYFNLGIQFSGRFLLFGSDAFDGVSDREISRVAVLDDNGNFIPDDNDRLGVKTNPVQGIQIGNKADRDAYFFLGISLTYTIKEVICPFKYEKKSDKQ
jgi:hypothetical protein